MQMQRALSGFLVTVILTLPPCATAQTEHKLPPGALEGIYVGFALNRSPMVRHEYYFTADGWVINNIPQVNMDDFDMAAYRNDPSHK